MPISYEDEASQLGTGFSGEVLPWWNPTVGSHRVKILEEGEEYSTTFRNQQIPKVRYVVEINGEKFNWGVNKGKTTASLWGQLVVCGKAWGSLAGHTCSVVVKMTTRRDGTNIREYTVLEAVNLMAEQGNQTSPQAPVQPTSQPTLQPVQPTPQPQLTPTGPQTMKQKMDAIRGQWMPKPAMIKNLGITNGKFNNLLAMGLIVKQGNQFSIA